MGLLHERVISELVRLSGRVWKDASCSHALPLELQDDVVRAAQYCEDRVTL